MTASSCFAQSNSMGIPCYKILCSGVLNVPLPYGMRLKVSPKGRLIFEQLLSPTAQKRCGCDTQQSGLITQRPFLAFFRVRCVKQSFFGTAFACGFLVEKGRRSQFFNETGLLRNVLLVNQKSLALVGASVGSRAQGGVLAMMSPVSLTGAAAQGVLQRQHFGH